MVYPHLANRQQTKYLDHLLLFQSESIFMVIKIERQHLLQQAGQKTHILLLAHINLKKHIKKNFAHYIAFKTALYYFVNIC